MKPSLSKSELAHGAYYRGHCRNARLARWNAERNVFVYRRSAAGHTFLEEIPHFEDFRGTDTFVPEVLAEPPAKEIPLNF